MTFFPEIDIKKTKSNADKKLSEYLRWILIAGESYEQKVTAVYSFEPRQPHGTPSKPVERLVVNRVSAEQELEAIQSAINRLYNPIHRVILIERYIYQTKDIDIAEKIGYERTQYYSIMDNALIAFAHSYKNGVLIEEIGKIAEKRRTTSAQN